jgi:hypothetical protein
MNAMLPSRRLLANLSFGSEASASTFLLARGLEGAKLAA